MNRRRYGRWLCSSMANLRVEDGSRRMFQTGIVEDISRQGLCVVTDTRISPGTPVRVSQGNEQIDTVARHCVSDYPDMWRVGLAFSRGYEWSESEGSMEHLLDPSVFNDLED